MLIVFGGLPGTGKTTISRSIAAMLKATYLRIDAIEQAIRDAGVLAGEVSTAGYTVAYALAKTNLACGSGVVIADAVNRLDLIRNRWRAIAAEAPVPIVEIEVVCSDAAEHRRRVEHRQSDIAGLQLPSWVQVQSLHFEPWSSSFRIDTAGQSEGACVAQVNGVLRSTR